MGVVVFKWAEEAGNNQLVLLMHRDNWGNRIIKGASWDGQILSGRCEDNNGTWLAISRGGRVAFLMSRTLLLDQVDPDCGTELYPIEFLEGNMSPRDFAEEVALRDYDLDKGWSYSLIVADMASNSMVHLRKFHPYEQDVSIQDVSSGLHTLSPHCGLDSTISARDVRMREYFSRMILNGVLGHDELPPLNEIASGATEAGLFLETMAEHPNPELGMQRFGTTSTTALAFKRTGEVMFFERYEHSFNFNIQ
ncbi:hypothetical protein CARUB_v10025131mg [Capsella rubella]|uniref:Uncharacterized protein n=1 Tax=Capsella rubella TaxID=81985 RepID=R0G103_9BRAS|nr:uncharacterized protein LOC17889226 [Capsella rubella]EOA28886.1 hypothetical protein CARUB_v10025131mg [Capsella rubella]